MASPTVVRDTATTGDGASADLEPRYSLRDRDAVLGFLGDHPYLVPVLDEARGQIARFFGSETSVALHVVIDREAEDTSELFALIETDLPVAEAARRLDEFDAAWWLDTLDRARCQLTIDIEPQTTGPDV